MTDYRPGLAQLPTYEVDGREWAIKVDANESTSNLPPRVRAALLECLSTQPFNRYPDMGMHGLKAQIAAGFDLACDNVLIGNGSSEILEKLFYVYGGSGRSIVFPSPSFSMYPIYAKLTESNAVPVPLESDYSLDPDRLLRAAQACSAKLIVLCSPNNPTGNAMPLADIERIAASAGCPVVVDEAYSEFHDQSAVGLLKKYPNVMIARTFSKAYAFASARVGYLVGDAAIIAMAGKACMPYHVNALSLAGAEIVYRLRAEFAPYIGQTIAERDRLAATLRDLPGVYVYPSATNFLLMKFAGAAQISEALAAQGIGVRDFSRTPALLDCLRITVGQPMENEAVLKIITACRERG